MGGLKSYIPMRYLDFWLFIRPVSVIPETEGVPCARNPAAGTVRKA